VTGDFKGRGDECRVEGVGWGWVGGHSVLSLLVPRDCTLGVGEGFRRSCQLLVPSCVLVGQKQRQRKRRFPSGMTTREANATATATTTADPLRG
jgi:hypothetical protein